MFIPFFAPFILFFGEVCEANTITLSPLLKTRNEKEQVQEHLRNGEKAYRNDETLRVSSSNYEPFMYQDRDGKFNNGIEYKLLKTISEKTNLNLSFKTQLSWSDYVRLMMKYV